MDYGQTRDSQVLPRTTYYLGLHRPTIKGQYSEQIWLVDELQKTAVDCNTWKDTGRTEFFCQFAHMFN